MMSVCDVVVGNSSSGLYEAPSFGKPTVNIGDRQKGRLSAESVIHVAPSTTEIVGAIKKGLTMDCSQVKNPYGDGGASKKIKQALEKYDDFSSLIQKRFFDYSLNLKKRELYEL